MSVIKLTNEKISDLDKEELCEWILSNKQLTQGEQCDKFEKMFAEYIGTKYAVFVNSGSSANLLVLAYLARKNTGKTVIVPAVSWATDYSPVVQLGFNPVLVDCSLSDLTSSLEDLEKVFKDHQPLAYIHVSVLGHTGSILQIKALCEKYNVILIEDNCESLGSKYNGLMLGNFGLMSTYSFYFSHHISTIEGGMVCTNDQYIYNILKMIREHGWLKNCDEWYKKSKGYSEEDRFKFYELGFNLRNTEIAGFLGCQQLKKFKEEKYNGMSDPEYRAANLRASNSQYSSLGKYLTSSFGIPYLYKDIQKAKTELYENNIEFRPIIAGSMEFQPMVTRPRHCPNAEIIHRHGLYLPNHTGITQSIVELYNGISEGNLLEIL